MYGKHQKRVKGFVGTGSLLGLPLLAGLSAIGLSAVVLSTGCSASVNRSGEADVTAGEVQALEMYSASLGTAIKVTGRNFPEPKGGQYNLVFDGVFVTADGARSPVTDLQQSAKYRGSSELIWDSFGPAYIPFDQSGNGSKIGVFSGTVKPCFTNNQAKTGCGPELEIASFEVEPSLRVTDFQPDVPARWDGEGMCAAPVTRGIGGLPYRLSVEALGFEPVRAEFERIIPGMTDLDEAKRIVRDVGVGATFSGVDGSHGFDLPRVPEGVRSYDVIINVRATDTASRQYSTSFVMTVGDPIDFYYDGTFEPAEYFPREPGGQEGCVPGGATGTDVDFTVAKSKGRTRNYNTTWSSAWTKATSVADGSTETKSDGKSRSVNFGTQLSSGGQVSYDFGGKTGIPGGALLGWISGSAPVVERGKNWGDTTGRTILDNTGADNEVEGGSKTSTDTTNVTNSDSGNDGGSFTEVVTNSESVGFKISKGIIAGTFGQLFRQETRIRRRAIIQSYNLCGKATEIGTFDVNDWLWNYDVALGDSCTSPGNLPDAACLLPPCTQKHLE